MRLPSLGDVVSVANHNLRRFPLVIASGVIAAWAGLQMIEREMGGTSEVRWILTAALGLPLMFGFTLFAERRAASPAQRAAYFAIGLAILAGFWWIWPTWTTNEGGVRYAQLSASFHLFCAFAPFIGTREPRAFWQYNRILFLRFLAAGLYSGVLFLGLAGAFLALDKLLGVPIANEGYARLWVILSFVFNPWFFVSGVPRDLGALESSDEYPTGLRVFTQYVLVPIVAIYLVIITIYFGKVLMTRTWPNGWIGYLVSAVATVGILSWLLVHPLEERSEHAWVKTFTRGFYIAIMPATAMLLAASYKRVEQYGITEKRYFLIVLALWLAGISIYYTISKSRSIKVIPMSLCAVAVASFAGPWGAYSVSMNSQRARLQTVLEANGMLADGAIRPAPKPVSDSAARKISEGFRYLLDHYGTQAVRPWIRGDMEQKIGAIGSGNSARADAGAMVIVKALGVPYLRYSGDLGGEFFSYYAERRRDAVKIEGYTHVIPVSAVNIRASDSTQGVKVRVTAEPPVIIVENDGHEVMQLPLSEMLDSVAAHRVRSSPGLPIKPEELRWEWRDGNAAAMVALWQISGRFAGGKRSINSLDGDLFVKIP